MLKLKELLEKWEIYNDLPLPVIIINEQLKCIFANAAVKECYGYTPEELKESGFIDLILNTDDVKRIEEVMQYSFLLNKGSRVKRKHKTKYGKIITADIEWTIQKEKEQKYAIFTIKDVSHYTNYKNFRNNPRGNNSQLYEYIVDNSFLNVFVLDDDFNISYASNQFLKSHRPDILGENIFAFFAGDIKEDPRFQQIEGINKYNDYLIIENFQHRCHHEMHEDKIIDLYCHYLGFNKKQNIVIYIRDHTEIDHYRQNLKELERLSESRNRLILLGETIAGIAHEINNPLTAILTNAQILARKTHSKETERISREATRISKIIKNLLSFSRSEQNVKGKVNVQEEIEDVCFLLDTKSAGDYILEIDIEEESYVFGDQVEFSQIIINLVRNAIAALENCSRKVVTIKSKKSEDNIEITITDTGCGIPKKDLDKIFEPFFTTKSVGKGTGLGLSMVFFLINKMKGEISVASQEDVGTTFTITLPRYLNSSKNELKEENKIVFKDKKFLIIDNSFLVLETLEEMLESEGSIVVKENDAVKGFQLVMEKEFDFLLIEARMPLLSGLEMFKGLKDYGYDVNKIILMAESVDIEEIADFAKEYKCKFIAKPFILDDFKSCLLNEWEE